MSLHINSFIKISAASINMQLLNNRELMSARQTDPAFLAYSLSVSSGTSDKKLCQYSASTTEAHYPMKKYKHSITCLRMFPLLCVLVK